MTRNEAQTAFQLIFNHLNASDLRELVDLSDQVAYANMQLGLNAQVEANAALGKKFDAVFKKGLPEYLFELLANATDPENEFYSL